jgi:hypothetical protein
MKIKTCAAVLAFVFILVNPLLSQDVTYRLKVVTEQANIRQEPDIGSRIIHMSPQNASLEAIAKQGEWYQVRFINSKGEPDSGYVHESLVIEVGPPPPKIPSKVKTEEPPPKKAPPEKIDVEKVEPEKIEFEQEEPEKKAEAAPQDELEAEAAAARRFPPINVLLSLGFSYRVGGDINTGAQGFANFYADVLRSSKQGEVSPVHITSLFGGEVQLQLRPTLALGLGLDYFKGKKESTVTFPGTDDAAAYTAAPELQSVPIRLALTYHILPEMNPAFYLKAGLDFHFASCRYHYRFDNSEFWEEWTGEASAQGFGFMAGMGFDVVINPTLVFFAEAAGNFAKISGFTGTNVYRHADGHTYTEEGELYIYQAQTQPENTHSLVFIRERKPSEGGVTDVRLATLDLSGFWLRTGIRIRF